MCGQWAHITGGRAARSRRLCTGTAPPGLGRPPFAEGNLYTIDAVSADDIWATGLSMGIWHWNGATWTEFTNPLYGYLDFGHTSANDVWLAGQGGGRGFGHWDGTAWTLVDSPDLGDHGGILPEVTSCVKD